MTALETTSPTGERADLMSILAEQRATLRLTVRGLDDVSASRRTTASELTLAGLIKHVTRTERGWVDIMSGRAGTDRPRESAREQREAWADDFHMTAGETLAGLLDDYARAAQETAEALAALPDLDRLCPLPPAPWFPPGSAWSVRRILLHLIRETSQHAGHADIIRESLDGASTTAAWGEGALQG
ncbi:DinB family protein [Marinactinospora endophytica]